MKRLVIAEKPSVGMSIASVLGARDRKDGYIEGRDYIVSWGFGHLAELANADTYDEKYAKWRYDDLPIVPANWKYKIPRDKYSQFETLKKLMNRADVSDVINACDAGREGELIFRNIYKMTGCKKPIYRLWISSMEDNAIEQGFRDLKDGKEYDNLFAAARCREWADWLVGINATRLFSILYHRTLNVGRVVSPTLALIVQREAEIGAFKPEPFYTAELDFGSFTATSEKFKKKSEADAVIPQANEPILVKSVTSKEKTEKAPALYDLTTLQRDANRQLGYTAQQTLDYVQSLYEKKLCTYPRTDSRYLTDDMADGVNAVVACSVGICNEAAPPEVLSRQICNSKKVSDHHAIMLNTQNKIWNATLYLRLSRDDGDKEESNSITGQRELLRDYISQRPEFREYAVRVDDGFSGSTFERPSFQKMIEDVKAGRTDCIIVKDLSRFGRNYLDAGEYIEKIFPFLGVRFIAVNDNYDSLGDKKASDDLIIPFKNLINEAYCRDISVKIRSQLEIKRKNGQFLGSFAAFGYLKDEQNKNKLVVDQYAADIVRDIFKCKLEGVSPQDIADALNKLGVLSPMEYKRSLGMKFTTSFKTNAKAVLKFIEGRAAV